MDIGNKPLVTVIIPTYKRKSILKALNSVLEQDYPNIEIIIVDDNASLPEYRKYIMDSLEVYVKNQQITLIHNERNLGGALSRNAGINVSNGEYIAFLDDDDWYLPGKIRKQVEVLINDKQAALVYCWSRGVSSTGTLVWRNHKCKEGSLLYEAMTDDCIASTSLIMCRREVLYEAGLFEDMPCKQDVFLELKLAAGGHVFRCIKEELVVYGNVDDDFERISNVSQKTVCGFQKCREFSREHYDKLSKKQICLVEANYSFRLCRIAKQIGDRKLFCEEMRNSVKYQRNARRLARIVLDFLTF